MTLLKSITSMGGVSTSALSKSVVSGGMSSSSIQGSNSVACGGCSPCGPNIDINVDVDVNLNLNGLLGGVLGCVGGLLGGICL
ncbi:hypothetical protein SAMD00019534_112010 [Acytostelium subglobosum LB1]|uniref:hypothetical protein n=1 Tax=Acytostelium subglobosum LB1 TaxID=1410327 RepID=UPI00064511A2|nr:hypothetical protein SAMD00019534_112010 [Acytostelium subglobosum LB1]GAM28025.1 hypothetical protein SAMD00019534_112010 [Acytostelium subglobosum LB1]|eukprot:XP_012748984.1 hypothetical protein SAMD00019534_112010 [Acytostelium subglobosum LB1]